MRAIWLLVAALAVLAPDAALAESWRHGPSGVSIPDLPDGLHTGRVTDSRGDGSDVFIQLGRDNEPVTFYVYRSAFPNPALWFERTRLAMNVHVGSGNAGADPRAFTLGGASAPNGLREEIVLAPGNTFRTTAVAIAQYGEWMVKVRITSASLDRDGIRARMDRLLAAIHLPGAVPAPVPLLVPGLCPDENRMSGRMRQTSDEDVAVARAALRRAHDNARGRGGLAAEPAGWCRERSGFPTEYGTVYRQRDGRAWTVLLGDSGLAVSALPIDVPDADGAATFTATSAVTALARIYDHMPSPDEAIDPAVPVLVGRERPAAQIDANHPDRRQENAR
jgi:hypothetical protein